MSGRVRSCIHVLALAACCGASVAAARAADVTLADLTYKAGPLTYRIPKLVVRGTAASREELARLADPTVPGGLGELVRTLDADEITVPELVTETGPADDRVTITTRDIHASGIRGGRVASVSAGAADISAKVADGTLSGGIGRMAVEDLDLSLAASLAQPGVGEALRVLYRSVSIEALRLTGPEGVTFRLARLTSRDGQARPSALGWDAVVAALSSRNGPVPMDRLAAILSDWAGSVGLGSFEAGGLAFEAAGPDRQAARIGRIGYTQGTNALNLEGLEIGGTDARLTIGKATLRGTSPDGPAVAVSGGDVLRRLLPGSGSIHLDAVALGGEDGNVMTIGTVDSGITEPAAASNTQPGTETARPTARATAFNFAARDIAMPLRPQDPTLKPLIDLGYAGLAGSLEGAGTYDRLDQEMSIAGLRLHVEDIGAVGLGADFTHVSPDLFQQDTTRAAMALLGMRALRLDITVEDAGLADRLVARQARLSGAKPEDVRRQYGGAASFGVMMALGTSPGAQTLGTALTRFVTKPGQLKVTLTAKDPAGLGMADLVMGPDPRAILDQVEVTAAAE